MEETPVQRARRLWSDHVEHFVKNGINRSIVVRRCNANWSDERILATAAYKRGVPKVRCLIRGCKHDLFKDRYCELHYNRLMNTRQASKKMYSWDRNTWARDMMYKIRKRAADRGFDYDLEPSDYLAAPTHCPILGIKFKSGHRKMHDASPTVDRLDNTRGYTKDNIAFVSLLANRIKSDQTPEMLIHIGLSYLRYQSARQGTTFDAEETLRRLLNYTPNAL